MAVCLLTGGSGFLGRHLVEHLRQRGPSPGELVAIGRRRPTGVTESEFRVQDLLDRDTLTSLVAEVRPSVVYHLAGKTPPGDPADFDRQNRLATISLLDALRASGRPCRVVMVGSAAELGPVPVEALPVGESFPCQPVEPYGLSKWLATCAGLAASAPLEVISARVFNPIGPGMPTSQALGRFARELVHDQGPMTLSVGDLNAARDFVDARDVAGALTALAEHGQAGRIYHVGTGRSHRIGDGLDVLIGLSGREVRVEVDADRARSRGPSDSRADVSRIAAETGWSARISWEQSLRDLWDDARSRAGLTDSGPSV
jgi:GDP-4-dehydro-6-deoxy-D-mannose reductase